MNKGMSFYKVGMIGLLILALMIPLMMINGLIQDRQSRRDEVVEDIARSSSYSQHISGPLLIVPYRKLTRIWKLNAESRERYQETV